MSQNSSYTPIILIGAARSGTKMLRDVIGSHKQVAKIPFDINFVWKFNNGKIIHDQLMPGDLNPVASDYIHGYFKTFAKQHAWLIEKTVSNSLRVDFVRSVFPNAKFIYLTRDGRDVVESVVRQWGTSPSNKYLLQKVRTFPFLRSLGYGMRYALDLIKIKIFRTYSRSYVWGVRYPGFEADLERDSVLEFCSRQWKYCVESSESQVLNIPTEDLLRIRYEDFVNYPDQHLGKIEDFMSLDSPIDRSITSTIKSDNIGKGFRLLSSKDQETVLKIIAPTLTELGY